MDKDFEFVTTIPAGGYRLLWLDEEGVIEEIPILAFMVYRKVYGENAVHSVVPVTAGCVCYGVGEYALLRPDGAVEGEDCAAESREAFEVELKRRRDEG